MYVNKNFNLGVHLVFTTISYTEKTHRVGSLIIVRQSYSMLISSPLKSSIYGNGISAFWRHSEYRLVKSLTVENTHFQNKEYTLGFHLTVQSLSLYHFISLHSIQYCVFVKQGLLLNNPIIPVSEWDAVGSKSNPYTNYSEVWQSLRLLQKNSYSLEE